SLSLLWLLITTHLCIFLSSHDTSSTVIYTLSLHDALPISQNKEGTSPLEIDTISGIQVDINDEFLEWLKKSVISGTGVPLNYIRSEEHTSELQSRFDLVCRLLLEKKKK